MKTVFVFVMAVLAFKKFSLQPPFIHMRQQESNDKTFDERSVIRLNIMHKIKL